MKSSSKRNLTRLTRPGSQCAGAPPSARHTVRSAAVEDRNLMPPIIEAVRDGVTVGEVSDVYRAVFGIYQDPATVCRQGLAAIAKGPAAVEKEPATKTQRQGRT